MLMADHVLIMYVWYGFGRHQCALKIRELITRSISLSAFFDSIAESAVEWYLNNNSLAAPRR
jgi:hypothetical protein